MKETAVLFGGSFDPPHKGHIEIIKKAGESCGAAKVVVVPAWLNPFKSSFHASPEKRVEWCRSIFEPLGAVVDSFEIDKKRAVYTIETIEELGKRYDIRGIIIGEDNLADIEKWKDFDRLNRIGTWCIFSRGAEAGDTSPLERFKRVHLEIPVSSSEIRRGEKTEYIPSAIKKEVLDTYMINKKKESY